MVCNRDKNECVKGKEKPENKKLAKAVKVMEKDYLPRQKRYEEQERKLEVFREQHGNELSTQVQSNMQAIQSAQLQIQALVEGVARDSDRKLMLDYAPLEKL